MDRLDELKGALSNVVTEIDRVMGTVKIEEKSDEGDGGAGYVVSSEQAAEVRKLVAQGEEIRGLIAAEESTKGLREFMGQSPQSSVAVATAAEQADAVVHPSQPLEGKSLAEAFTDSDEFKALIRSGGANMPAPWTVEAPDLGSLGWGQKDVYTASVAGTTTRGFGTFQRDPLIPLRQRLSRVRDLFPVQSTTANLIDYFRVSGFTNAASVVPERVGSAFAPKPQSSLTFTVAQAPVRTIAHYEVAHRNVLADEPQLQGIINNELLYGLRLHEDYQILQGTGTSEDLLGVLNTSGIQTYTQAASPDTKADAVRRAMTKVILAYYEPTGTVLHPYDWEDIELIKTSQFAYVVAVSVAVGAEKRLWRSPVVDTPAMPEGTFLTGAFGLGAQLYDREQGNIRVAEQHSDFFVRNAIVVLAEERLALAVKRPESFVKGTFI